MKLASSKDTSDDRAVAQRTRSIANGAFASAVAILAVVAVPKSRAQTAPASPAGGVPAAARAASTIHQDMCAACHAGNGTGGPGGAANLIRSPIAMADDGGKTLGQFLQAGRPEKGMPPFPLQSQQATQLSIVLRLLAQDVAPGGPTASAAAPSSILVGDAEAGKRFFRRRRRQVQQLPRSPGRRRRYGVQSGRHRVTLSRSEDAAEPHGPQPVVLLVAVLGRGRDGHGHLSRRPRGGMGRAR